MKISQAKELKRKAESDITRILYDLAAKVEPSRIDMRLDVESMIDTSGTMWEQRITSIAVRIDIEL